MAIAMVMEKKTVVMTVPEMAQVARMPHCGRPLVARMPHGGRPLLPHGGVAETMLTAAPSS